MKVTTHLFRLKNNNFTISWIPEIYDIGYINATLSYRDKFHQLSSNSINFTINVINFTNPYFEYSLSDITVFAGEETKINIPNIMNPSNATFDFSVQIEDQNLNNVNTSDWFVWNQQTFMIFPK